MIVFHSQRFAAKRLRVSEAFLRERGQQSRIGKVKRVFGGHTQSAPRMLQRLIGMAVTKVFQAFFEIAHPGVCWGCGSDPVGHRLAPSLPPRTLAGYIETIAGNCGWK